jgi:hypothetical protein
MRVPVGRDRDARQIVAMTSFFRFADRQIWSLRATWPPLLLAVGAGVVGLIVPIWWLSVLSALAVIVLLFDCLARDRQFRELRLALRRAGGLSGQALARFRKARNAWCSRRAALAAATAEGLGLEARNLVDEWGYKPWHVFPDGAFTARSPFLRRDFWFSVLGLR